MNIFSKILKRNGNLGKFAKEVAAINSFAEGKMSLSDEEIKAEIAKFKQVLSALTTTDEQIKHLIKIRPEVYAIVKEATRRAIGKPHYDVQLAGGIALAGGRIAEMKTGEGKTQTAILPLVLFALAGRGAHLVTVNDYLARWHASLMGPVFDLLGLSVSSIQNQQSFLYDPTYKPEAGEIEELEKETDGLVMDVLNMRPISRQEAYKADITYGTNNEFGFDYLRDNMARAKEELVQRELFYVIVDEVDSILIDEARTPLIISAPDTDPTDKYIQFSKIVSGLEKETHYQIDEKHKASTLTDDGISYIEKILGVENIYDTSKGVATLHQIEQALKAKTLFLKDRDYVIKDGEIVIVDEFTGHLMYGRRYSEGLHQAIEAKEGVKIQAESKTLATITFQNLFRLYTRLSGMSGTAKTEEEELFKIYKLQVEPIPSHRPMVRKDMADLVYKTENAKFEAITLEVKERHRKGQPVLIGTVSIAKNEELAEHLKKAGVPFEILNAKNHEREASIIAQAGSFGAVTLATNIAGRGVDILLGGNPVDPTEAGKVREVGGLHIIGTERHESRRIDNQLRGRAGRQGDPGSSQFFVSLEDDLMRVFGGPRLQRLMTSLGIPDDQPIEAKLVSRSIESAQKRIEGLHFDSRKHVLEFDDVLNHQRETIYKRRRLFMTGTTRSTEEISQEVAELIKTEITNFVRFAFTAFEEQSKVLDEIKKEVGTIFLLTDSDWESVLAETKNSANLEFAIADSLSVLAERKFEQKKQEFGPMFDQVMSFITLNSIDTLWMEHLDTMSHLRDSVRLRGYAQRDPLVEYRKEGHTMFIRMLDAINREIVHSIFRISLQVQVPTEVVEQKNLELKHGEEVSRTSDSPETTPDGKRLPGRNDPCYCGSGKKFKKCHGQ